MSPVILIATRNDNKLREIAAILDLPGNFTLKNLIPFPEIPDIVEDAETYRENAVKKAETVAGIMGEITIADDSGLSIDHLNGFPGVHSARYLGKDATDIDRCYDILKRMNDVPSHARIARFICAAALANPVGDTIVIEKSVKGIIAQEPAGKFGFGYDPIFFVPEFDKVMAELTPEEKNRISHRALAFKALKPHLLALIR